MELMPSAERFLERYLGGLMSAPEATAPTFLDAYIANVSASAPGIDPSVIAAIIAFIMQMISMCAPLMASSITSGGNVRRIALYRAMLANGVRPLSAQGRQLAEAMEDEASKLSQADAAAFIGMCQ